MSLFFLQNLLLAQDIERGKIIFKTCIQCHGPDGMGMKEQEAPSIKSQHSWYIESSIKAFKSGERKNPKMLPYIKGLSDSDIRDVAAYVNQM